MAVFDPTKPFGTIAGHIQGCEGAKYAQAGAIFNNQKRCLREPNGDVVAKNSDISSPGKSQKATPPPPTESKATPESDVVTGLNAALKEAEEAFRQVPSTANAHKIKALKSQLESQEVE